MMPLSKNNLNILNDATIKMHLKSFLCDDSVAADSNDVLLVSSKFQPDTFSVKDRLSTECEYLSTNEIVGQKWLELLIKNEIEKLINQKIISLEFDISILVSHCLREFNKFLNYKIESEPISATIFNQEIPDVARKLIAFVLFGNPNGQLDSYQDFNDLAWSIIPGIIETYLNHNKFNLKKLLHYSIASGLIGLDMKGGAAAASNFSTIQIPLKPLLNQSIPSIQNMLINELNRFVDKDSLIDYWDSFNDEILKRKCRLVWILDDCIESFFDLYFIQESMKENLSLNVSIIPKRGKNGNDMTYDDVIRAIDLPIFKDLKRAFANGMLSISNKGPNMGTVNIRKLSWDVVSEILISDCILVKGCRAHELMQGGIKKVCYTAYVLAREFSEGETGFDARLAPILFFRSEIGEYAYWGFKGRTNRYKMFEDGRSIKICYSTLEEHERRKEMSDPKTIFAELHQLMELQQNSLENGYKHQFILEIKPLVEKLVNYTRESYNISASDYKSLRKDQPHEMDVNFFDQLLMFARAEVEKGLLGDNKGNIHLLDIGTGPGRDLRYFRKFKDIKAVGIDNSEEFINVLKQLATENEIEPDSFFKKDMRDLRGFQDSSFDIVRHNATLLHLPMITSGVGVDEALEESYRVLKPHGILFVLVKKGEGMGLVDTQEGLGGRFFQFFTEETLEMLLVRNQFNLLDMRTAEETRPNSSVTWLAAYAQKIS
jgi:SAM-dependent methyltransferase